MSRRDTKVFIACHRSCRVPEDSLYFPLQVGAAGKQPIGFTADSTGDNISALNPVYCELTGLYWCWKNLPYDCLGLVHYRRYFASHLPLFGRKQDPFQYVLKEAEAEQLLDRFKVIVPKRRNYYIETVYSHYAHTFDGKQLDAARKIIAGSCPLYLDSFDRVMSSRGGYMFNMFIMYREQVDSYCSWLFDVLKQLTAEIDQSAMTDFEKRYAGRISEILLNVWLDRQIESGNLRKQDIHELPVIYMGRIDWPRKVRSFLAAKFLNKKYDKSF